MVIIHAEHKSMNIKHIQCSKGIPLRMNLQAISYSQG